MFQNAIRNYHWSGLHIVINQEALEHQYFENNFNALITYWL
jgi:hypothetical protein